MIVLSLSQSRSEGKSLHNFGNFGPKRAILQKIYVKKKLKWCTIWRRIRLSKSAKFNSVPTC